MSDREQMRQRPLAEPGLGWISWPASPTPTLLSIVTVFRRDFEALQQTLVSLAPLRQPWVEWVVIEGDCRIDSRSDQLRDMAEAMGMRVKWCVQPDSGIYDAMNRGLLASQGEWVWFLNAGDLVPADFASAELERDLRGLTGFDWLVGSVRMLSADGDFHHLSSYVSTHGLASGDEPICHQGVIARRSALALTGLFDASFRISADYKNFLQLSRRGDPGVLDLVLAEFRLGGMSSLQEGRRERENLRAREDVLRRALSARVCDYLRCAWRQMVSRSSRNLV